MISGIDFTIYPWLINYFHVIGIISLFANCYTLFLVLFKSEKLDNFKYYSLAFQTSCFLVDAFFTFLMQPHNLYPMPAGFCTGVLAQNNLVPAHVMIDILTLLVCSQFSALAFCFWRKYWPIKRIDQGTVPKWLLVMVVGAYPVCTCSILTPFYISGKGTEEKWAIVQRDYPEYEQQFRTLDNFGVYDLSFLWEFALVAASLDILWFGGGIFYFTKRIYEILGKLTSSMSANNLRRHKSAMRSLVAQLVLSIVASTPFLCISLFLMTEFRYAQVIIRVLLMLFGTHAAVNAMVLVITTPPYRNFTFFWRTKSRTAQILKSSE